MGGGMNAYPSILYVDRSTMPVADALEVAAPVAMVPEEMRPCKAARGAVALLSSLFPLCSRCKNIVFAFRCVVTYFLDE